LSESCGFTGVDKEFNTLFNTSSTAVQVDFEDEFCENLISACILDTGRILEITDKHAVSMSVENKHFQLRDCVKGKR
jgi:purine nucleoside phosphorylase